MRSLKIALSFVFLLALTVPFKIGATTLGSSEKAAFIDGQYAGYFRYYLPEDPDLYIDCYVYVGLDNPTAIKGVRFHTSNGTYRAAVGTVDGLNVSFTSSAYPGTQFAGTLE